jgi:hypothetical protein
MDVYAHIGSIGAEGRKSIWLVAVRTPYANKVAARVATRHEAVTYASEFMAGYAAYPGTAHTRPIAAAILV